MKFQPLSLLIIPFLCGPTTLGQASAPSTHPEVVAMDAKAKSLGLSRDIRQFPVSTTGVHEIGIDPEISSGNVLQGGYSLRNSDGSITPSKYNSQQQARFHRRLCAATTLVVATYKDSEARLNTTNSLIYTVSRFEISNVIRSSDEVAVSTIINVVTLGGTVNKDGETLKLRVPHPANFKVGQNYLLLLSRLSASLSNYFTVKTEDINLVRSDRIFPATDADPGDFYHGEKLGDAMKRADSLKNAISCK